MKTTLIALFFFSTVLLAQTQINPATQVRWPAVTGAGAPTSGCPIAATATLTSGSATITVSSAQGVYPAQAITGTGIPASTTVQSVDGFSNTLVMSAAATASGTGVAVDLYPYGMPYTDTTDNAQYVCMSSGWRMTSGGIVYPPFGVPLSTGSAWGTSYQVGMAANDLVQLGGSAQLPAVDGSLLTGLPSNAALYPQLNQNTTGTAANVTAAINSTLTTLSALSLPWPQLSGVPPLVNSFNGRTGAVAPQSGDYTVGQVTGAAPLANPSFTGINNTGGYTQTGTAANLFTGIVTADGLNLSSQQSSNSTPVNYDHFGRYAEGTSFSNQVAESGTAQWNVTGEPNAIISGGHLTGTGSGSNSWYAYLNNTPSVGGTPQTVSSIGTTFRICPVPGYTYTNPNATQITLAALHDTNGSILTGAYHMQITPTSWVLQATTSTVPNFYGLLSGVFNPPLQVDCQTEYTAQINFNYATNAVQVLPPRGGASCYLNNGTYSPTCTATDANLPAINPLSGFIEGSTPGIAGPIGAALSSYGSFWLDGPSVAVPVVAGGAPAPAADLANLGGVQATAHFHFPPFTIPNAASGGGTGWYRIATAGSDETYVLNGVFTFSVAVAAQQMQSFRIYVNSRPGDTPQLILESATDGNIIDQVRLSNNSAGDIGLDIHVASGMTNSTIQVQDILGVGIFTPLYSYTVGATPFTNSQTLNIVASTAPYSQTFSGANGWFNAFTASGNWNPAGVVIQAQLTATAADGATQQLTLGLAGLGASGSPGQCYIDYATAIGTPLITQARCSWDSSTDIQVDLYVSTNIHGAVTTTGQIFGPYVAVTSPATGATPLSGGNIVQPFINSAIYNATLSGGAGYYEIATGSYGGGVVEQVAEGEVILQAANLSYGTTQTFALLIDANSSTGACAVHELWGTVPTFITNARCSYASATGVQLEIYDNVASTYPVTLTGTFIPTYGSTWNPYFTPTVGSTPLSGGNVVYPIVEGLLPGVAPLASPTFTGTVTAPTFSATTSITNAGGYTQTGTAANTFTGSVTGLSFVTSSGRKGTFVCTAGGTITVANANELVTSDVIISLNTIGGTITTPPAMKTVTAGTGFTVLCGATDTSTYNYDILN